VLLAKKIHDDRKAHGPVTTEGINDLEINLVRLDEFGED